MVILWIIDQVCWGQIINLDYFIGLGYSLTERSVTDFQYFIVWNWDLGFGFIDCCLNN